MTASMVEGTIVYKNFETGNLESYNGAAEVYDRCLLKGPLNTANHISPLNDLSKGFESSAVHDDNVNFRR